MKRFLLLLIIAITGFANSALGQTFNYGTGNISSNAAPFSTAGGTGITVSGNDITVTANVNMAVGTYNFANFTINAGVTVTVTGTGAPLIIKCTGNFTNNGELRAVPANAGNASGATAGAAGAGLGGGAAGGIGGAGGNNGTSTTASGTNFGTSTGAGIRGCGVTVTRPSWAGPGGGGGSYGSAGTNGGNGSGQSTGCATGGVAGTVYGNASLTTQVGAGVGFFSAGATAAGDRWLLAGSGGAGGHGTQSIVASARAAGGGGGGGGAAIQITATNVTIGTGAWIRARGGFGGNGSLSSGGSASGGGGGGGSGGTINIQYLSSYTNTGNAPQVSGGIGGSGQFGTTGTGGSGGSGGSGRVLIEQDVILCTAPSTQATTFNFNTVTTTSCNVTFTRGNGTGGVLVVARQGSAVNTDPTSGTSYTANSSFGSGSQIGTGNWVVFNSNSPSSGTVTVPVNNLVGGQTYHFAIYEYNATATCYNMTELAGSVAIPICSPPSVQASGQNTPTINSTNATIAWTGNGNGDAGVIVVVRQGSAVNADPVNTTTYTANTAFGIGSQIGTGNYVAYIGSGSSVNVTGLLPNTAYHYAIYTYNSSGPCYMTPAAIGNFTSANGPMAYISSTSIQQTGSVLPGSVNQAILQVQIVTNTGTAPALTLNSLTFNTNGTTATTNLNGARIYYTSTSSTFATTTQYGSDVTTFPGGSNPIVVNGSQTLVPGTNYFWIVYDVAISAPTGNLLDAECTSINIGSANTPSVTAPSGNRPIVSLSSPSCAYTYASFSSFPSIVGLSGTVVAGSGTALDDNQYTNITMPGSMTFEYNGKVYSSFGINANGFIWFGSYNPVTGNVYNPISTTLPYEGVISAMGGDLQAHSSATTTPQISYRLAGTAPNRTLAIEWTAFMQWGNTGGLCPAFGSPSDWNRLDFQIKLYENDLTGTAPNRIEITYFSQAGYCINGNGGSYQIGLRGAANTDYLNRTQASGNWTTSSTAAGSANNSTCAFGGSNYINGNLGFRFTPVFQKPTVSPTPTASNICPAASVTLTGSVGATTRQWYANNIAIPAATTTTTSAAATGSYVYTVSSGGCTKISEPVAVTINSCGPMTWVGGTSGNLTNWDTPSNWTPAGPPSAGNDIIIPNTVNDPVISLGVNASCKDVSIAGGATIFVDANKTLDVKGNWTGANNVVSGPGKTIFSGSTAQTITGGGTFSNLQVNNSAGVTVASGINKVNITGVLELKAGQLTTNGNLRTISNASGTAYINDYSVGFAGTLSGNVAVQRYITSNNNSGFRYIGTPVITTAGGSTLNLSGVSGFVISGTPGQTIPATGCPSNIVAVNSPYGTFMRWEESGPFTFSPLCRQQGWWFQTTGTMTSGRGYGAKVSSGNVITYTGAAQTGNVSVPCTHTVVFSDLNNGWNLVANPYPSPIKISNSDVGNTANDMPAGFDGQVQFYLSSGPLTGTYYTYNVGSPNPTIPAIALGQGFWVRLTNPGTGNFVLSNGHRKDTTATYYNNNSILDHNLNVTVTGNGYSDATYINFIPASQTGFDYYDGQKWDSRNVQPTLYTKIGSEQASINSLPSLQETVVVPMGMKPGTNGNFTFTFDDIATFPQTSMIFLEDLKLGTMVNLRANNSYNFNMTINDDANRFMLHFQPGLQAEVADQDCDNAGSIELTQPAPTVWSTYEVRGNDNNVYAQGTNLSGTITIANLPPQEYVVSVTHASGYTAQEYITVNGNSQVNATISASATNVMVDEMVSLTANANNATEYVWNFGDGNTAAGSNSVVHAYDAAGTYNVTVTAASNVCDDVANKTIVVGNTTGITGTEANTVNIYGQGEHVVIEFNSWGGNKADIFMYNALGQRMESLTGVSTLKGRQELYIADIVPGTYFIQVVSNGKTQGKKLLLGKSK